jgi:DNA-binding SARP family transcriptional activator
MRIWLLGGFRAAVGSRAIGEGAWRLRKAASLLKLLALTAGHRLHREQAMDLLWSGLKPEAANNLHYALHVARRALEPSAPTGGVSSYLHLRGEWLALCPEGQLWVDVEAFEEAAATARHALEPAAFRAAIDLYPGDLLPQDLYEPWVEERRVELREVLLWLLLELAGLYEERGQLGKAIEALGSVVAVDPSHEGASLGLMRLYAASGRRREALAQYQRLKGVLLRQFGAEPEVATSRLQEEIWADTFSSAGAPSPYTRSPPDKRPPQEETDGRHNLPLARTSFVGCLGEVLEVKRLLAMTRLLTLTGAGGSGKTRLALKVARDLAGAYPEGIWLVELTSFSEPEFVPQAAAQALGVRERPNQEVI